MLHWLEWHVRRRVQCLIGGHMPTMEHDEGSPFIVCDWCGRELDWEKYEQKATWH